MKQYNTTKEDFELYKKECDKWIAYWGLLDWEVTYVNEANENARGSTWWNISGRIATIGMADTWPEKPSKHEIKKVAFHEVCELMLSPLTQLAQNEYSYAKVEDRTHPIIRRLENKIFERK